MLCTTQEIYRSSDGIYCSSDLDLLLQWLGSTDLVMVSTDLVMGSPALVEVQL